VVVHCGPCGLDAELEGVQSFRCPRCGEPSIDLRQGANWRSIRSKLRKTRRRNDHPDCGTAAGILKKNDELAAGLRARYAAAGVLVLTWFRALEPARRPFWSRRCADCGLPARGRGFGGRSGDG